MPFGEYKVYLPGGYGDNQSASENRVRILPHAPSVQRRFNALLESFEQTLLTSGIRSIVFTNKSGTFSDFGLIDYLSKDLLRRFTRKIRYVFAVLRSTFPFSYQSHRRTIHSFLIFLVPANNNNDDCGNFFTVSRLGNGHLGFR